MFNGVSTRIAAALLLLSLCVGSSAAAVQAAADTVLCDDVFPELVMERGSGVAPEVVAECLEALRSAGPGLRHSLWPYSLDPPVLRVRLLMVDDFRLARTELGGAPDWGVGLSVGRLILVDCSRAGRGGRTVATVFIHEIAHSLVHFAAGSSTGVPRWFHEGVAQTASGEWRLVDNVALILGGRVPSPATLQGAFPASAAWADQAYRSSLLAVTWLKKWYGPDVTPRILLASRLAADFEAGFISATGTTVAAFSARFDKATRWRFGWVISLTRWPGLFILMALIFAAGAAARIVRTRRRLAAMPDYDSFESGVSPDQDRRS